LSFPSGAKQAAEKVPFSSINQEKHTSVAKATADFIGFVPGINPRPTTRTSFSAACKARDFYAPSAARLNSLRKKSNFHATSRKSIPQWLKPPLISLALCRG
jgi:hypothetical protein